MKLFLLIFALTLMVQSPERSTPPGEWCQRPPITDIKGHACECMKHDCTDSDPTHLSAHVDPKCMNYCTVKNCMCPKADCP